MLRRTGLIATVLLLLSAASVSASTHTITVTGSFPNFSFPASTSATIGDTIKWVNHSGSDHTVTGDASLNLWNKSLPINATVSRSFTAAGSFRYHCNIHSFMHGDIVVSMTASAHSGTTATTFTLHWATATAATGFKYIVQKRAPGGSFTAFKTTSSPSGTFKTGTTGTWQFRARLKRTSNGAVSDYSPRLSISVTH
jgi:plastocyanin